MRVGVLRKLFTEKILSEKIFFPTPFSQFFH